MTWAVVYQEAGVVVTPWDDEADTPALDHTNAPTCWCQPIKVTTDPPSDMDIPIWTHREPSWPGADDTVSRFA